MDQASFEKAGQDPRLARTLVLPTGMTMVFSCSLPARAASEPLAFDAEGDDMPEPGEFSLR
jgi:hypothetical protein